MTLRHRVYHVLEAPLSPSPMSLAGAVRLSLATLIVANIVAVVVQTVPGVDEADGTELQAFETFSLAVFTLEYVLRLWSASEHAPWRGIVGRLRWACTPAAIVDLLSFAPSFVLAGGGDCRLVRVLRLLRLVRVAKLGRYSIALRTLRHVLAARLPELVSMAFVLVILLVLSSALMFHFEHDAQPQQFSSIPAAMWWGIVTLTTIGYGDMTPVTVEGRLLGAVVAVLGIGMFALPAGLLGGAFVEELGKLRRAHEHAAPPPTVPAPPPQPASPTGHCPHCHRPLAG